MSIENLPELIGVRSIHTGDKVRQIKYFDGKIYAGRSTGISVYEPVHFKKIHCIFLMGKVTGLEVNGKDITAYRKGLFTDSLIVMSTKTLLPRGKANMNCDKVAISSWKNSTYLGCDNSIYSVETVFPFISLKHREGIANDIRDGYNNNGYGFYPSGEELKIFANRSDADPVCGNGIVEYGEICDMNMIQCTDIEGGNYVSGTAVCLSDCSGYDISSCKTCDGWGC